MRGNETHDYEIYKNITTKYGIVNPNSLLFTKVIKMKDNTEANMVPSSANTTFLVNE